MKNKILILIALVFSYNLSYSVTEKSQSTSSGGDDFTKSASAGSQFLKIPVGAAGTGMGGAYGSKVQDLSAVYWNPAGLADIKSMQGMFAYTSWFAGFSHNFAAAAMPMGSNFTAAISFVGLTSGDIRTTSFINPDGNGGTYSYSDLAVGVSIAGYLTDQFSFGATAKLISNSFSSVSASGVAFDIGTKYDTGIEGIKLGFSLSNLGTQMAYSGQDLNSVKRLYEGLQAAKVDVSYTPYPYSIPLMFRASASFDAYKDDISTLSTCIDFLTLSDSKDVFAIGLEYVWDDFVYVRSGYQTGNSQIGFGAGVGLKYNSGGLNGLLDYSIQPSSTLGLVNRFTVGVGF